MNSKYNNNNSGFSLVELVVIVLIMGIVSTITVVSMSKLFSSNASSCANMISANLERARIETMSKEKGEVYAKLYYNSSDGYNYIELVGSSQAPERISKGNITLEAVYNDGSRFTVSDAANAYIYFDKTTGIFVDGAETAGRRIKTIIVDGAYKVELVIDTGRNYVEKN